MKLAKKQTTEKINPREELNKRRSLADSMEDELKSKGVDFFNPTESGSLNIDKDYLQLPSHITEVPAKDLGEYLNAFTQQKAYMRTLLSWAECNAEESKRKYIALSQEKYNSLSRSKISEKEKERRINSEPDVLPAYEKYQDDVRKCTMIEYNINSIEDIIFMISREVSRRTGDISEENRNYNVGRK